MDGLAKEILANYYVDENMLTDKSIIYHGRHKNLGLEVTYLLDGVHEHLHWILYVIFYI